MKRVRFDLQLCPILAKRYVTDSVGGVQIVDGLFFVVLAMEKNCIGVWQHFWDFDSRVSGGCILIWERV